MPVSGVKAATGGNEPAAKILASGSLQRSSTNRVCVRLASRNTNVPVAIRMTTTAFHPSETPGRPDRIIKTTDKPAVIASAIHIPPPPGMIHDTRFMTNKCVITPTAGPYKAQTPAGRVGNAARAIGIPTIAIHRSTMCDLTKEGQTGSAGSKLIVQQRLF